MRTPLATAFVVAVGVVSFASATFAGQPMTSDKKVVVPPEERDLPMGAFTFGAKFSEDLTSGYIDSVTPFWAPGDFVIALNSRYTLDDDDQFLSSTGLGVRYLVPDREIIIGANVFYDSIHSV